MNILTETAHSTYARIVRTIKCNLKEQLQVASVTLDSRP